MYSLEGRAVQLRAQLREQFRYQLWDQLRDQLRDQLGDQLWWQLWGPLADRLWSTAGRYREQEVRNAQILWMDPFGGIVGFGGMLSFLF